MGRSQCCVATAPSDLLTVMAPCVHAHLAVPCSGFQGDSQHSFWKNTLWWPARWKASRQCLACFLLKRQLKQKGLILCFWWADTTFFVVLFSN